MCIQQCLLHLPDGLTSVERSGFLGCCSRIHAPCRPKVSPLTTVTAFALGTVWQGDAETLAHLEHALHKQRWAGGKLLSEHIQVLHPARKGTAMLPSTRPDPTPPESGKSVGQAKHRERCRKLHLRFSPNKGFAPLRVSVTESRELGRQSVLSTAFR